MADFCMQCSIEQFDKDYENLKGLCKPGEMVMAICEACGPTYVDSTGRCLGNCSDPTHGTGDPAQGPSTPGPLGPSGQTTDVGDG